MKNKKYFDTYYKNLFNDDDIRKQLFPMVKYVFPSMNDRDCIFDIGSHTGDITDLFHNYYPQSRIFLAEPLLLNCEITNRRFNKSKNIITINTAIGLNKSTISWKYDMSSNWMHITRSLFISNVTFMYLDNFYDNYAKFGNIFFLKIDVEGYEDEVLFSSKKLLSRKKIYIIYLEYHYTCKTKSTFLILYLEKLGYNCYLVGKYKIIKVTHGCLFDIDMHYLSHILCFSDNFVKENSFISYYNRKYGIT